jgi:hypothetical protein
MPMHEIGGDLFEVQRHRHEDQPGEGGGTAANHHEVVGPQAGLRHLSSPHS